MKIARIALNIAVAGTFGLITTSLHAQGNLVLNGSFEDATAFNHWNVSNNTGFLSVDDGTIMSTVPVDGNSMAVFGGYTFDSIDQTLATTAGLTYDVNFFVNNKFGNSAFQASWGGSQLLNITTSTPGSGQFPNGWINFDFQVTATSASTDLSFAGFSVGAVGLDNVTVIPVPEPSSLALAGLGATGLALAVYRRRTAGC